LEKKTILSSWYPRAVKGLEKSEETKMFQNLIKAAEEYKTDI
jgi:hypothetical protein